MINFHIHSSCSDGVLNPKDLLELLKQKKLSLFSITDHDNVDAYKIISDRNLIPGVELSADYQNGVCHILGYGIDLNLIENFCQELKNKRIEKGNQMIAKLKSLGYDIELNVTNKIIGRRELCNHLIEKKYFNNYLEAKNSLFEKGKPCYIKLSYPKIEECINIIHEANGLAVIAHPWTLNLEIDELEKFLKHYNFDGIEVYNHNIDKQLLQTLEILADKNNLYKTCGTDFHGYESFNDIVVNERIDCRKIIKKLKRNE